MVRRFASCETALGECGKEEPHRESEEKDERDQDYGRNQHIECYSQHETSANLERLDTQSSLCVPHPKDKRKVAYH